MYTGEILTWIQKELSPRRSTTDSLIYDHLQSQSNRSLVGIYRPFDPNSKSDWSALGSACDFLWATRGQGKKILDFGPGDGWPSLLLAPSAGEVVGVDSSLRRVEVCRENASRLEIPNARFVSYQAGSPLPFSDQSFDAVTAASSIEQTPDPRQTLAQLYRVLKPGGRLRMSYEGLDRYRGGGEQDIWVADSGQGISLMVLYDRDLSRQEVTQYVLHLQVAPEEILKRLEGDLSGFRGLTVSSLEDLRSRITQAGYVRTCHPSADRWSQWLEGAGFSRVVATHSGARAGAFAYRQLYPGFSGDMSEIREALRPWVELAITLECPLNLEPRLTAVK